MNIIFNIHDDDNDEGILNNLVVLLSFLHSSKIYTFNGFIVDNLINYIHVFDEKNVNQNEDYFDHFDNNNKVVKEDFDYVDDELLVIQEHNVHDNNKVITDDS